MVKSEISAKRRDPYSKFLRSLDKRLRRIREGGDERTFLRAANGIVHVGANEGQEATSYDRLGVPVVWIEPLPEVFDRLVANLVKYPQQTGYCYLMSDEHGSNVDFYDAGQSSSMLAFADHRKLWPTIDYSRTLTLKSSRLDRLIADHGWTSPPYDALVVDAQGADLHVLRGAGDRLSNFSFIVVEAADFEAYQGGATVQSICDFLRPRGFTLKHRATIAGHPNVGTYYNLFFLRDSRT